MPKFQVYKDAAGKFRFRLRAENNKIIAIGEAYEQYAGCINGIKSIQKNSTAPIEDTTVEGQQFSNPKFQVYKDNAGKFRFHLNARNGEIIAESSEGYETKDACLNSIDVVGQSGEAEIEDLTESEESATAKTEDVEPAMSIEAKTIQNLGTTKSEVNEMVKEDEMLAELKKIREALEKPAPPPPPAPQGLWNEFKDFLSKYKIFGLAIAFIIGLYLGTLIQALVKDLLLPAIGLAIPGMDNLAQATAGPFTYGDFLVALITFIIVAFIAFIAVKVAKKWKLD
jgi:large conductance mechanosensitive channel protein